MLQWVDSSTSSIQLAELYGYHFIIDKLKLFNWTIYMNV